MYNMNSSRKVTSLGHITNMTRQMSDNLTFDTFGIPYNNFSLLCHTMRCRDDPIVVDESGSTLVTIGPVLAAPHLKRHLPRPASILGNIAVDDPTLPWQS